MVKKPPVLRQTPGREQTGLPKEINSHHGVAARSGMLLDFVPPTLVNDEASATPMVYSEKIPVALVIEESLSFQTLHAFLNEQNIERKGVLL